MHINKKRLRMFLHHTFGIGQFLEETPLLPWTYTIFHTEDDILKEEKKLLESLHRELEDYRQKYTQKSKK